MRNKKFWLGFYTSFGAIMLSAGILLLASRCSNANTSFQIGLEVAKAITVEATPTGGTPGTFSVRERSNSSTGYKVILDAPNVQQVTYDGVNILVVNGHAVLTNISYQKTTVDVVKTLVVVSAVDGSFTVRVEGN